MGKHVFYFLVFLGWQNAAAQFSWNIYLDLELSRAGDSSRFYTNEINRRHTDWRLDLPQINAWGQYSINERWTTQVRLLGRRTYGQRPGLFRDLSSYRFSLARASISYTPLQKQWQLEVGRILNPFGLFYRQPYYWNRVIIPQPLAYQYYLPISERGGYFPGLGRNRLSSDFPQPDWGLPMLYPFGYKTGVQLRLGKPFGRQLFIALVNGAANLDGSDEWPPRWGLSARLVQPTTYLQWGLSLSTGSFLREAPIGTELDRRFTFTQSLLGVDLTYGKGFFQLSSEIIGAWYRVPQWSNETADFILEEASPITRNLYSFSAYLDLQYEPPSLSGLSVAIRLEGVAFANNEAPIGSPSTWAPAVARQVLALSYRINRHLALKGSFSTQQQVERTTNNHHRAFRLILSSSL